MANALLRLFLPRRLLPQTQRLYATDAKRTRATAPTGISPAAADFVASRLVSRSLYRDLTDFTHKPDFSFLTGGDFVMIHGFGGALLADTHAKNLVWPPQDLFSTLTRTALHWPGLSVPISDSTIADVEHGQRDAEKEAARSDETALGRLGLPLDFPFAKLDGSTDEEIERRYRELRLKRDGFAHVFPPYQVSIRLRDALKKREAETAHLEPSRRVRLHEFDYDFRLDNVYSARRFRRFLDGIAAKSGGSQLNIIAHSMGGQVTLSAISPTLAPNPPEVSSVLFAGSPFQAVPTILFLFHHPHPFLPLTPLDALSWRSGYAFLPEQHSPTKALMSGRVGAREDLDLNLQDPETWISSNLANPLIGAFRDVDKARDYIARALETAEIFRGTHAAVKAGQHGANYRPPKMATLFSKAYRTPTRVLVKSEGSGGDVKVTHVVRPAAFAPGDGIVALEALRLSEGWEYSLIPSLAHHAGLMNDLRGVEMGFRWLLLGEA